MSLSKKGNTFFIGSYFCTVFPSDKSFLHRTVDAIRSYKVTYFWRIPMDPEGGRLKENTRGR